jgi:hypothetical protein
MDILISPQETKQKLRDFASNSPGKISFIFGAGASAGYTNNADIPRPPVVADILNDKNELVARALSQHSNVAFHRSLIKAELVNFNNDLEEYLSDLFARDKDDTLFSDMLSYLESIFAAASHEIDQENNNYRKLFYFLKEKRANNKWSLISFNYDTILEQSFKLIDRSRLRRDFETDENYAKTNPPIIKVHGGINYRYQFDKVEKGLETHDVLLQMLEDGRPVESYLEVQGLKDYIPDFHRRLKSKNDKQEEFYFSRYNFPLMMIPVHGTSISKNSFFAQKLLEAKEEIKDSELVISIGYNFGDICFTKALEDLALAGKELILVGTNSSPDSLVQQKEKHVSYLKTSKLWDSIRIFDGSGFAEFADSLF